MLTLTTHQRNLCYEEQMELLQVSYTNLMKSIRRIYEASHAPIERSYDNPSGRLSKRRITADMPPLNYIRILEPHKSGYAHLHILLLTEFTDSDMNHIRNLWADKYNAGEKAGMDFSVREQNTLKSPIAYIMKYLSKTLSSGTMSPFEQIHAATIYQLEHDPNARGVRLFSVSRGLSKIMKCDQRDEDELAEAANFDFASFIISTKPDGERFTKRNGHDFHDQIDSAYQELMKTRF